jgi:deoxycytidine triphosphate deaminase
MTSSVLSDGTIRRLIEEGRIKIDPWDPDMLQPASVDLRLGPSFRVFHNFRVPAIDLADPPKNLTEHVEIGDDESFVIHPGEFVLGRTLEQVEMPDDLVSRIEGKALAVDTEVPTPQGWVMMGDLQVGDEVFDAEGRPVEIVATTPFMYGRECREVVFSDGTKVVADASHQWEVHTKYDRRRGTRRVVTTAEMEKAGVKHGTEYLFQVDRCGAVQYPERELPIDPYFLGAWIGDGHSSSATVTTADPEIVREIEHAGYGVRKAAGIYAYRVGTGGGFERRRDPITGRFGADGSLNSTLREMDLLGHKEIPVEYLESSVDQRRALLQGLMDTDGYVDKLGRCDITTVSSLLAEQYRELIASLGYKVVVATKLATLYGKVCGLRHEVTFMPDEEPVFRLPRKLARQRIQRPMRRARSIVDIRPVPSVPVRCIEIADPRGVYLASESFIPTHNSSLGRLGLIVHATAGFVDPGFKGTLTLEITNLTRVPIILWPGKPIAQLSFMTLDKAAERPYGHPELGSHYHGQLEATESRYEGGPASRNGGSEEKQPAPEA